MFWGLILEPKRTYGQIVDTPFHVSMASLDLRLSDTHEDASTLIFRQDDTEYILGNLSRKHKIFNIPLALDFDVGEQIEFYVEGHSTVHLTGFLATDGLEDEDEDAAAESSKKEKAVQKAEGFKRKLKGESSSPAKKAKIFDESLDDDSDEDDYTVDEEELAHLRKEDDSDEEGSDDDDDEDDEDDLSDEAFLPVKKDQKPQQQQKQGNNESSLSKKQKKKQKLQEKSQQQQGNKQTNQQQSNKQGNQQQQKNNQKTPQKSQQPNKTPQKTPQAKTPQLKTPQTGNKQQNVKSPQGNSVSSKKHNKKVLKGGIIVEDLVEGRGKVATTSTKLCVYYVGRLASNKKEFDKHTSEKPFSFSLGRGEVIRGWDLGLEGMREGGKRKIVVPPKFAYGQSGAPPSIPPNSALEFEVTLVKVK